MLMLLDHSTLYGLQCLRKQVFQLGIGYSLSVSTETTAQEREVVDCCFVAERYGHAETPTNKVHQNNLQLTSRLTCRHEPFQVLPSGNVVINSTVSIPEARPEAPVHWYPWPGFVERPMRFCQVLLRGSSPAFCQASKLRVVLRFSQQWSRCKDHRSSALSKLSRLPLNM